MITLESLQVDEVITAVKAFDVRFGEMERVVWCISKECGHDLVSGAPTKRVEGLVW